MCHPPHREVEFASQRSGIWREGAAGRGAAQGRGSTQRSGATVSRHVRVEVVLSAGRPCSDYLDAIWSLDGIDAHQERETRLELATSTLARLRSRRPIS